MSLRKGHGTGAGQPRIEVLPPDELPAGVPENADQVSRAAALERGPFAPGNRRSVLGGRARRGKTRLAERMGLRALPEGSAFRAYKVAAASFRRAQCAELARTVGGGVCGPGPSSMIASAALQLAWSRYLADAAAEHQEPDLALAASRLADASRQNLLAAHELCAKEAAARKETRAQDLADLVREMQEGAVPRSRLPAPKAT
jgi:hypothetical protein